MALEPPKLDDRSFVDLMAEARARILNSNTQWVDLSPGDPGVVLLEAFAYLTDVMLYRLNRLPVKAYIEFLRLMDLRLSPPIAARAELEFRIAAAATAPVEIPALTRVTVKQPKAGRTPPVFLTAGTATITPGNLSARVLAYHADMIEAELAGTGTGKPGQVVALKSPPVVAPIQDFDELVVGVQMTDWTPEARVSAREYQGKTYRIWRELDHFSQAGDDRHVFTIDRMTGAITFAPALRVSAAGAAAPSEGLAEYPPAGMEIRVWYARGGGPDGNVTADSLQQIKDAIPGAAVSVNNPAAANGGAPAETVDNALLRGPQQLHSLERAVTARDFEMLAVRVGGAARALARTEGDHWAHATPGTVEVMLVPRLEAQEGRVTAQGLREQQNEQALEQVRDKLDAIKPLGTRCKVTWVGYRTVQIKAEVVVYRGENPQAIRERILKNLHEAINPLATSARRTGWKFGEPLRVSRVYDIIQAEPGVDYVERIRLVVEDVPNQDVMAVAADAHQADTWHAAADNAVFRSMNNGDSWERTATFDDKPELLQVHPDRPGFVAAVLRGDDDLASRVYFSADCAETWRRAADFPFRVEDIAWTTRDGKAALLLATAKGLYEVSSDGEAGPKQIVVDPANQDRPLYAVTTWDVQGSIRVAVSAQSSGGIYLSVKNGESNTFVAAGSKGDAKAAGLINEDVRVLAIQQDGARVFLWAGLAVPGNEAGSGCYRLEVSGAAPSPEGWRAYDKEWVGGSCYSLAFSDGKAYAATHHAGVVVLNTAAQAPVWSAPNMASGLPTGDVSVRDTVRRLFQPVHAAAISPHSNVLLACGPSGVFRRDDDKGVYRCVSETEFTEKVSIPETWLLCSGNHEVEVVNEREAR